MDGHVDVCMSCVCMCFNGSWSGDGVEGCCYISWYSILQVLSFFFYDPGVVVRCGVGGGQDLERGCMLGTLSYLDVWILGGFLFLPVGDVWVWLEGIQL